MVEDINISDVKNIIEAIHKSNGIDLSNYAFSSLKRRISRFIEINKIHDMDSFVERIKSFHDYADTLVRGITVNVTEMFRDPSFWTVFRNTILPQLSSRQTINIWHAACSTGEEVYSMAILLKEAKLLDRTRIIATDLNTSVLEIARKGVYSFKNLETNNRNYENFNGQRKLSDYYLIIDDKVFFDRQLVENVDFRCHNLAQEGPISCFDVILCRNVMIYFNFELQERILKTFYDSMSPDSFLAIGSKETIGWCKTARYFREVCYEEKIYRKMDENRHHIHFLV